MKNTTFYFIPFVLFILFSCSNKKENDLTERNLKGKVSFIEESEYSSVENAQSGSFNNNRRYRFDENGNMIEENIYDSFSDLNYKRTFKYDKSGNKIEETIFTPEGGLDFTLTFKYDENGNQIEENAHSPRDSLIYKHTHKYEYDNKGNWIKSTSKLFGGHEIVRERIINYYD